MHPCHLLPGVKSKWHVLSLPPILALYIQLHIQSKVESFLQNTSSENLIDSLWKIQILYFQNVLQFIKLYS